MRRHKLDSAPPQPDLSVPTGMAGWRERAIAAESALGEVSRQRRKWERLRLDAERRGTSGLADRNGAASYAFAMSVCVEDIRRILEESGARAADPGNSTGPVSPEGADPTKGTP